MTFVALLVAGLAVGADNPTRDALNAEWTKLSGTWQLVSAETDGKKAEADFVQKVRVVIKDGKHTVYLGEDVVVKQIPVTIDPSKKPKTSTDTLPDGRQIHGIYELDGDTLKSCTGGIGKERPREFSAAAGTGNTLRVFKRVKE